MFIARPELLLLLVALLLVVAHAQPSGVDDAEARALQSRIVGGSVVTGRPYPWLVSLQRTSASSPTGFEHFCGGTLIHPQWILTAGHCVRYGTAPARVQIGQYDLDGPVEAGTRTALVSQVVRAPGNTDSAQTLNDVALLKLSAPLNGIPLMAVHRGALVDDPLLETTGTMLTVAGWGKTTEGAAAVTDQLRAVDVPVFDKSVCDAQYALYTLASNQICAGFAAGGKDSCDGDSGGPLFHMNAAQQPLQLGVVSFGEGCARQDKPGVYARVSSHASWIATTIDAPLPSRSAASLAATGAPVTAAPITAPPTPFPTLTPTKRPTPEPTAKPTTLGFSAANKAECFIAANNGGYATAEQSCEIPFTHRDWQGRITSWDFAPRVIEARPFGIDALGVDADSEMRWCPTKGTSSYSVTSTSTRKEFGFVSCRKSQLLPTPAPTFAPSRTPTRKPSVAPSKAPSKRPSLAPTKKPSLAPTKAPSKRPTTSPTPKPTLAPTSSPTTREFFQRDLFCRSFQRNVDGCSESNWHDRQCQWRGNECRARLETRPPTGSPTAHPSVTPSAAPVGSSGAGGTDGASEESLMEKSGTVIFAAGGVGVVALLVLAGAFILVRRRSSQGPGLAKRVKSMRSLGHGGGFPPAAAAAAAASKTGLFRGKLFGKRHGNQQQRQQSEPRRRAYSGWAENGAQFVGASMSVFKKPMKFVSSRFGAQQTPISQQQQMAAYAPPPPRQLSPPVSPHGSMTSFPSFHRYESSSSGGGSHGTVSGVYVPPPPGFAAPAAVPVMQAPPRLPRRESPPAPPRLPRRQSPQEPVAPPPPGLGFSTRFSWRR